MTLADARASFKYRGAWGAMAHAGRLGWRATAGIVMPRIIRLVPRTFVLNGEAFTYDTSPYNRSWDNERSVEIPIFRRILATGSGRVLEVGDVLGNYGVIGHDVVDRYEDWRRGERAERHVIRADVLDFVPAERYDVIVSISTLEHVGFDGENEPRKLLRAVDHLTTACLAPGGVLAVSLPVGYNPHVATFIETGELRFDETFYLRRIARRHWTQVASWSDIRGLSYNQRVPSAEGLVIGLRRRLAAH
jgi:SAM-dependent methyltransferase